MATTAAAERRALSFDYRRFAFLLIGMAVLLFALAELSVRIGLCRVSRIEGRTEREYRAAVAIGSGPARPRTVLSLGSSWLGLDVDLPALQKALGPGYAASRLVIEQTAYLDWYYGMRKLYARGSRPNVVVLFLNATDMAVDDIRGDYFGWRLMRPGDVLRVSRDAGLGPTQTFSLFLANFSAFYGTRVETRKFVLAKTFPPIRDLRAAIVPVSRRPLDPVRSVRKIAERLKQFDALVRAHGGTFVFVKAPTRTRLDDDWAFEAASRAGVAVLVPMAAETIQDSETIEDRVHLNPAGAARLTGVLGPMLRNALDESR